MENKMYTVNITNNETGEVITNEQLEGLVLLGMQESQERGIIAMRAVLNLSGKETLHMLDSFAQSDDVKKMRFGQLLSEIGGECGCPKCTKKREEANEAASAEEVH